MDIEQLENRVKELEKQNTFLSNKVDLFEKGDANLYYAVRRKMSEFAVLLNNINMVNIDMGDKNDQTFGRVTTILEKCEKIAISASALGVRSGIELVKEDMEQEKSTGEVFTPEMAADQIGKSAGQNKE
jgi:chaperonin cofactor prefoldin